MKIEVKYTKIIVVDDACSREIFFGDKVFVRLHQGANATGIFIDTNLDEEKIKLAFSDGTYIWIMVSEIEEIKLANDEQEPFSRLIENVEEKKPREVDRTSIGYKAGTMVTVMMSVCLIAIMIALTAKLILWML